MAFITNTKLTLTEQMCSQLGNFFAMETIASCNKHEVVFIKECLVGFGLLIDKPFKDFPVKIISLNDMSDAEKTVVNQPINQGVIVDNQLKKLDPSYNYDFHGLFHSYRYWYPAQKEVIKNLQFKDDVFIQGQSLVHQARTSQNQKVVSVHVRRTGYLMDGIHAHLTPQYYHDALARFNSLNCKFLFFSDDIEWCKNTFDDHSHFHFSMDASPEVDLCAMSLCDHNIIANSSFSLWGALLNKNQSKTVIHPNKFLVEDNIVPYLNSGWCPDSWTGIDVA